MLQYVCGYGRCGRRDTGDKYAGADGEDYRTGGKLQCQTPSGADAGIARLYDVGESVRTAGRQGEVIPVSATATAETAPGVRIHGLPSEHHCKGLLQRPGICLRQARRDRPMAGVQPLYWSQQVELYRFVPNEEPQCCGICRRTGKGAGGREGVQLVCGMK